MKSYNIPIRKVFRQTRHIWHTEEAAFESAIAAAKRTSGFIVVSSLDRLERNGRPYIDFVSGGGTIVAVDEGFGVHESDVRDPAAKAAVVSSALRIRLDWAGKAPSSAALPSGLLVYATRVWREHRQTR